MTALQDRADVRDSITELDMTGERGLIREFASHYWLVATREFGADGGCESSPGVDKNVLN
ncbi:hypothetical protein T265_05479 [Opisthorchis viverrini]|uniref:Uncharacterized protein n=1 Tax=Opisthorchis viverrini TaxID=6198 RepID=A0A074ZKF0_OPIVI|nr:hypothetical protein T265_05479 [Opisthorchis viverrini]KER27521.1 hypothetical protein T265_05479 [Opisthorchis viverrini]